MAITITIDERMNFGDVRAVIFKSVATTSTNTLTAALLGLQNILAITDSGGAQTFTWSGVARATTGSLVQFSGGTESSGTAYGLAIGY